MQMQFDETRQDRHIANTEITVLAFISVLPLIGAQFGYGNQAEQIAIITRIWNPELLDGDFFTESAAKLGQPRFYYALIISWLAELLSLPVTIHGLGILMNFLLGLVTFHAARQFLGANSHGAIIAATLAVTNASFNLGFAGYLRFDSFQPANIAVPVALFGFAMLLHGRFWWGAVLGVLASLFHPTIGAEVSVIGFGAVAVSRMFHARNDRNLASLLPLTGAFALFAAGLLVLWALPNLGAKGPSLSDDEFFAIIAEFRAPHHYLGLEFRAKSWLDASLFAAALVGVMILHVLRDGLTQPRVALGLAAIAVIALCGASLWFVDIQHSRVWVTAQVFRMTLLLKWVAFLYFGWAAGHWISTAKLPVLLVVAAAIIASADANPYVVVLALVTWAAFRLLRPSERVQLVTAMAFVLIAAVFDKKYGVDEQALRAIVAVAVLAAVYILPIRRAISLGMAGTLVAVSLAGAVLMRETGILGRDNLRSYFGWSDLNDDESAMSRRAGEVSPAGSVWIVPPGFEMFSALAQRPVVVNFTSIPFEDAAIREWRNRMEVLYGPVTLSGFGAARQMAEQYRSAPRLEIAAQKYGASYAILYADTPWDGEVLAKNNSFKVVRIAGD